MKSITLELSNLCNSSCCLCKRRRYPIMIKTPKILDILLLKEKVIPNLTDFDEVILEGEYCDPCLYPYLFDLISIIYNINPFCKIFISTNGSMRNKDYFSQLALLLTGKNYEFRFAIDGLKQNHEIYRVNTNWDTIISNALAFIDAGGKATWQFVVFKHNEQDLKECFNLSKQLGFLNFLVVNTEITSTWDNDRNLPISIPSTGILFDNPEYLSWPIFYNRGLPKHISQLINNQNKTRFNNKSTNEKCYSNKLFLSHTGIMMPCCWCTDFVYFFGKDFSQFNIYDNDYSDIVSKLHIDFFNMIKTDVCISCPF